MYLDDEVSLDIAIIFLKLDRQEKISALTTLIMYANNLGLTIYFDDSVQGYNMSDPIEETFYGDGDIDKLLIGGDPVTIKSPKTLKSVRFTPVLFESNYYFSVFSFECDATGYYMVDEGELWLESTLIGIHKLYIKKQDLINFKQSMGIHNESKVISYDDSPAVLKALALLSKSYADKDHSFKIGENVNATAIKEEILSVADDFNISFHGLKKIDDKISSKIKELELNENSKMDNSK